MTIIEPGCEGGERDATAKADNAQAICRASDNEAASLPRYARLPINRCNVPALILGSLTFQRFPSALALDGVAELHADLFRRLDAIDAADTGDERSARAAAFADYLAVHFCLDELEKAGLGERSRKRAKANWRRVLRGWSFDSDGREGAVLKGWVESRFGLLARFHGQALRDFVSPAYLRYQEMRSAGLYGTNALESQLDLVYAYGQYELARRRRCNDENGVAPPARIELYRGINRIAEHEVLCPGKRRQTVLLNNLVSFTSSRERAGEFGDTILTARVPTAKIFSSGLLLPDILKGEDEYLVIGGVYEVAVGTG